MAITRLYALCMLMILISLLGFITENIWLLIRKGYMDNRNMHLPFLLGYGMVVCSSYFILGIPGEFFPTSVYMSIVFSCVCLGEIIFGYVTQWYLGFSYWDYSSIPTHITKYTSVFTSMCFSIIITLFMGICWEPLYDFFLDKASTFRVFRCFAVVTILFIDMNYSMYLMHKSKAPLSIWQFEPKKDQRSWQ